MDTTKTTVTAWNPAATKVTGTLLSITDGVAEVEWVAANGHTYIGRFTNWR